MFARTCLESPLQSRPAGPSRRVSLNSLTIYKIHLARPSPLRRVVDRH